MAEAGAVMIESISQGEDRPTTRKRYIVAHHTGTGGDKAVLADGCGRIVHSAYQLYGLHYPQLGWVEQDPEALWQTVAATWTAGPAPRAASARFMRPSAEV
jgi:glycerol kinase